mgnify:CR=1 FL=1
MTNTTNNTVSKMWSELVDANWELSTIPTWENMERYNNAKNALIDTIGQDEYDRFIEMGRKMFGVTE